MSADDPAAPSGRRYDTVTFLSDYGNRDEFAGVVRSVLHQLAPGVAVIDLTHEIPPFDIRAGSLALARSVQYLAPGVVLAVVDPGVGGDRRAVAVEIADGAAVLVGPDNGLLAAAVAMAGGASRAVVLDNPEYHLGAPGPTFAGRDIFAPAAAHLCSGVDLHDLGTAIDPAHLLPGLLAIARHEDGEVVAEVLWVDHYGNCQLNVEPDEIAELGDRVAVTTGDRTRVARRIATFADVGPGELGMLVDSYGLLALVVDQASAAAELRLDAGDEVHLAAPGEAHGAASKAATSSTTAAAATPVTLGRRPGAGR